MPALLQTQPFARERHVAQSTLVSVGWPSYRHAGCTGVLSVPRAEAPKTLHRSISSNCCMIKTILSGCRQIRQAFSEGRRNHSFIRMRNQIDDNLGQVLVGQASCLSGRDRQDACPTKTRMLLL